MKDCISFLTTLSLMFVIFNLVIASEKSDVYLRIKKAVDNIWIIDTHEHLMTEKERLNKEIDFFYLFPQYASSDLVSSGMSEDDLNYIWNPKNPLDERWKKFYPYWEKMKNTAYAKCVLIAVRDLFGIDDINENTYKRINKMVIDSNREGWYKHVLKDKARIDISFLDVLHHDDMGLDDIDGEFFLRVKRFDECEFEDFDFVTISPKSISLVENNVGIKIHTLENLIEALDIAFQKAINEENIIAVKSALAYYRIIRYEDVPIMEAEKIFYKKFKYNESLSKEESKKFEDFMFHQIIKHAIKYNLPIQIHTGLQEGNENVITNSKPTHLINLFMKYKDARFIIFHGSYPYMGELATLAKNFPNVYLDMCWMHIISPSASKRWLEEWLETVPSNKILAYGGDWKIVEGAYGHAEMARECVAEVLAKKVDNGYFSEKEAVEIAKRILRENALELFKLKKVGNTFQKR